MVSGYNQKRLDAGKGNKVHLMGHFQVLIPHRRRKVSAQETIHECNVVLVYMKDSLSGERNSGSLIRFILIARDGIGEIHLGRNMERFRRAVEREFNGFHALFYERCRLFYDVAIFLQSHGIIF